MKELEKAIEKANIRLEETILEYDNCDANNEIRCNALMNMIRRWESYIKGLEDAKKFIEGEK